MEVGRREYFGIHLGQVNAPVGGRTKTPQVRGSRAFYLYDIADISNILGLALHEPSFALLRANC
jgi:hypothetical protein